MKILLITDYATPTGGAEISILNLRDRLRDQGHDARLFASNANLVASTADYLCFGTISRFRTILQTFNPWAYFRLRAVLQEFQPDVVHVAMFLTQLSPLILPLLKHFPNLYQAQWHRAICPTGFKLLPDGRRCIESSGTPCLKNKCLPTHNWLLSMVQMKLMRRWQSVFRRVITVSEALKYSLEQDGFECNDVVHLGAPFSSARSILTAIPTACFAGRLVREKGVAILIKAFAIAKRQIPNAKLLIAGDGPERESLEVLITALSLKDVVFYGHISQKEVEANFAGAWVQAVPSIMEEPFGLVACEAMLRGTPVVASATGGLLETIVDGEVGLLVPPGDVDSLAESLIKLLSDPELARKMGLRARDLAVAKYTDDIYARKIIHIYQELVTSQRRVVHAA